jgi:hypothetical protein
VGSGALGELPIVWCSCPSTQLYAAAQERPEHFLVFAADSDFSAPLNTDTGATATMKTTFTHCLTLRITPEMDSMLCDAAHDGRLPKSAWIRWAIERCLQQKRQRHEAVLR